jgi:hypothetical protein
MEVVMSELQQFADEQEMEFYAAVADIVNALDKFGPDVLIAALQGSSKISNLMIHETSEDDETDLTNLVMPDTMYLQ